MARDPPERHDGFASRCRGYKGNRTIGRADTCCGEQHSRDHRFANGKRNRAATERLPQRFNGRSGQPEPARALGNQCIEEPRLQDGVPHGGRRRSLLHRAHGGGIGNLLEHPLERVQNIAIVHQRNPMPRAIIPRKISRVPPRSEKLGATWVTN